MATLGMILCSAASSMNVESLIGDLALILVLGAVSTLVFRILKQPMVLGYIVAGFLASPYVGFLPDVANVDNIDFWAQIGIIVLLFSLGLEFSFHKLMNVGGSAVVTALVIVAGMMGVGFVVGRFLDFNYINSMFLGGMLSMSSTTIIIKAFDDLNMRHRHFAPLVLAVLICEDLFAVVMMVLLSSVALNNSVAGSDLLVSVLRLMFFLVILFSVGVFVIPTMFRRFGRHISNEMLLVISMGLCLLTAVGSAASGFSMALGAFMMGSILAGTVQAERIEHVVTPVKDLFGAVFFISVGMMVNPHIITEYAGTIALLSVVVIVGMISFGTLGMLITGQPLRIAIESGFSLTQIGEFAFIIATLGMSLGVLDGTIYPIVVSVSVITTFFTPYFIKASVPCYEWVAKRLPPRLQFLLDRYSKQESTSSSTASLWVEVLKRDAWRVLLHGIIVVGFIVLTAKYLLPFVLGFFESEAIARFAALMVMLTLMMPFVLALVMPSNLKNLPQTVKVKRWSAPLVVMLVVRVALATCLVVAGINVIYSKTTALLALVVVVLILVLSMSRRVRKQMRYMEHRFLANLNERELVRSGKEANLVSDLHVAQIRVGYGCPFVGEKLINSQLRQRYGVNVVSIQRGRATYPVPGGDVRIFPGDLLGVIGTDEQIQALLPVIEDNSSYQQAADDSTSDRIKFVHFEIGEQSPLVGKTSASAGLRSTYCALLVAIQRGDIFIKPTGLELFRPHDILWMVGDYEKIEELKG